MDKTDSNIDTDNFCSEVSVVQWHWAPPRKWSRQARGSLYRGREVDIDLTTSFVKRGAPPLARPGLRWLGEGVQADFAFESSRPHIVLSTLQCTSNRASWPVVAAAAAGVQADFRWAHHVWLSLSVLPSSLGTERTWAG